MNVPMFPQLRLNHLSRLRWQTLTWNASGNFWDSSLGKTLHHGVHGLLFVLIVLVVISMVPHGTRRSEVPDIRNITVPQKLVTDSANAIVAAHLFGQAQQKLAGTVAVTASSITVDGIAAGNDPKDSIALLTTNGQSEGFHVGQVLPDGEKLVAINSDSVELADGSNIRRITLPTYGTPDSEGPAAYAALLHGIGLSNPDNIQQNLPGTLTEANVMENAEQPFPVVPVSALNGTPVSAAGIVHIPVQATPLEQLQSLRAQLVHPR